MTLDYKDNTKIGCIPNSQDYSHPQDRRRYIPYFRERGIKYETADYEKDYDVVYVSLVADLNKWVNYKAKQKNKGKQVRMIFDLSDFYLVGSPLKDRLRAIFHYLSGRTQSLKASFKQTVINMIEVTDVLICGSFEQKEQLSSYHSNVVIVRDYFGDDVSFTKKDYALVHKGELNVVWEGLSHGNVEIFKMLREILVGVKDIKINVHVITDSEYCRVGSTHFCQPTYSVLKEVFSSTNIRFHHYDWNPVTFSSIATACDLALIPITDDPFMMQKPENKLLLFWSLGVPAITSDTRSYSRVMKVIGEDYTCSTLDEWQRKITTFASSKYLREMYMKSASKYLSQHTSLEAIIKTGDEIFFGE